jgi:formate hydrogenlyase subunit 3/multisubunit Na+/H+ antiporter MnhD subunit
VNVLAAIPGPLFFFVAALAIAGLSYLVHRWRFLSGLVAALGCLSLGWLALCQLDESTIAAAQETWPFAALFKLTPLRSTLGGEAGLPAALALRPSLTILGREWALTSSSAAALTLIWTLGGLALLLSLSAARWSASGSECGHSARLLVPPYPFGMALLAFLSLSVTAQQILYALLFLWLAAIAAVFVLAGGQPRATTGAFRLLTLTAIAMIPLLTLPRFMEVGALQTAMVLAIIGFGILMMTVPFHGQIVATAADGAPMTLGLLLSVWAPAVLYLFVRVGQAYPQLLQDGFVFSVLRWMGTACAAIGGLAALGQRRWGYLIGYATLIDWGAALIALGTGTSRGLEQAAQMLVLRAFSLLLVGTGWGILCRALAHRPPPGPDGTSPSRQGLADDHLDRYHGMLRRRPLAVLALCLGLLSLAGFPLTPGGAGRWPLIQSLAGIGVPSTAGATPDPRVAWVLVLAGVGASVGTLVGLRACLGQPQDADPASEPRLEAAWGTGFSLLAMWLVAYMFLRPAPWIEIVRQFIGGWDVF